MIKLFIDFIGWIATVCILIAFYLNTRKIIKSDSNKFLLLNLFSGLFMALNSGYYQAYPSMITSIFWLLIAFTSLIKK
jgi:uncharacterized protein with PQ loop repeat